MEFISFIFFPLMAPEVFLGTCLFLLLSSAIWLFSSDSIMVVSSWANGLDFMSSTLIALTILISILMVFSVGSSTARVSLKLMLTMIFSLNLILVAFFKSNSLICLYITFELSLVPIMLLIFGWGGQPERILASLFMVMYTISASLPLLIFLIFIENMMNSSFTASNLSTLSATSSKIFSLALIMGFLVKFPMFPFHLWLPKAHVEAPVVGSMVLAAILLKLGGFGIIRFASFFGNSFIAYFVASVSTIGGAIISLLCVRQKDMKILIAYSSVCHMSLVVVCATLKSEIMFYGALLMMIAHGLASSGMFSMANMPYERGSSRSMVIQKGILSTMPALSLFWFLLCAANMAAPPFLNLPSEILMIIGTLKESIWTATPVVVMAFMAATYNLLLYSNVNQPLPSSETKTHHSSSVREICTLFSHFVYLILGVFLVLN